MTERNSDLFITSYNRLDRTMRRIIGTQEYMSFFRLIDLAKKKNAVIRKYEADLREYGDLRNAIVHHRTTSEYAIAEPHDDVVAKMKEIEEALTKPVTVSQMFSVQVTVFQETDSLSYALKVIKDKKYNQFPVYRGKQFLGLITPVRIVMWMASQAEAESLSRTRTTLKQILDDDQTRENFKFIPKDLSVYEALEKFQQDILKGRRLEALLITEDGEPSDKLIGIVTPLSLIKIK